MTLIEYLVSQLHYEQKKAQAMIMAGLVLVNEEKITISSYKLKLTDQIRIKETKTWVSRGAYKLLAAIKAFNLEINNKNIWKIDRTSKVVEDLKNIINQLGLTDIITYSINY